MSSDTKPYRLKGGTYFHFDEEKNNHVEVKPGQVVQLTAQQAVNWRDRFEPVTEGHLTTPPEASDPTGERVLGSNPDLTEENDEDDDEDGEDEEDEDDHPVLDQPPAGSEEESPIARRRREKAERKAAKKNRK